MASDNRNHPRTASRRLMAILLGSTTDAMTKAISILDNLDYKYIRRIGRGNFGDVMEMKEANQSVAMKLILKDWTTKGELENWHRLNHENVLKLSELLYLPDLPAYIFKTPIQEATLDQIVASANFTMRTDCLHQLKSWFVDILEGLAYMHGQQLAHLDIKTSNILISREQKAILCDFTFLTSTSSPVLSYGAPLCIGPPEGCLSYGRVPTDGVAVDIWCFGMMALNCLMGHRLFLKLPEDPQSWVYETYPALFRVLERDNLDVFIREGLNGAVIGADTMDSIYNFVQSCIQIDPAKRPTAQQILHHTLLGRGSYWGEVDTKWTRETFPGEIRSIIRRSLWQQKVLRWQALDEKDQEFMETPLTIVNSDGTTESAVVKFDPTTERMEIIKVEREIASTESTGNSEAQQENQEQAEEIMDVVSEIEDGVVEIVDGVVEIVDAVVEIVDAVEAEDRNARADEEQTALTTPPHPIDSFSLDRDNCDIEEETFPTAEPIYVPKKKKRPLLCRFIGWLQGKIQKIPCSCFRPRNQN